MVVAGESTVLRSEPYTQDAHVRRPMLVHHLALMRTADARRAARLHSAGPVLGGNAAGMAARQGRCSVD